MVARLGVIPLSVLRGFGRGALSERLFLYQRERPGSKANTSVGAKAHQSKFEAVGLKGDYGYGAHGGERGSAEYGLSVMPAEMVRFFVRYYSAPGQVYLDPFMGQGVQLQVAKLCGLDYYGYDISREFCDYIDWFVPRIDDGKTVISAVCADSREPDTIPDGIGDFCFTSPPYWNMEYYGEEPGQLGKNSYEAFLRGIEDVARAWRPKFKPEAFVVINVGDFRINKRFYPYSAHTVAAFEAAGWKTHDVWVLEGLVGLMQRSFAVMRNLQKIAPRVHEYGLVFRP